MASTTEDATECPRMPFTGYTWMDETTAEGEGEEEEEGEGDGVDGPRFTRRDCRTAEPATDTATKLSAAADGIDIMVNFGGGDAGDNCKSKIKTQNTPQHSYMRARGGVRKFFFSCLAGSSENTDWLGSLSGYMKR